MWLTGIEINGITRFKNKMFSTQGKSHTSLPHHIKFLPGMRVHVYRLVIRLRFYRHQERISLPAAETTCQTLILIGFPALDTHSLSVTSKEISPHPRFLAEHQHIKRNTVFP